MLYDLTKSDFNVGAERVFQFVSIKISTAEFYLDIRYVDV